MTPGNGDAQRFEKLDQVLREQQPRNEPIEEVMEEFTLQELARFLARHGQDQEKLTREFATRLLESERRKMVYVEKMVGKLSTQR
jgi:hypothetical protein